MTDLTKTIHEIDVEAERILGAIRATRTQPAPRSPEIVRTGLNNELPIGSGIQLLPTEPLVNVNINPESIVRAPPSPAGDPGSARRAQSLDEQVSAHLSQIKQVLSRPGGWRHLLDPDVMHALGRLVRLRLKRGRLR